MTQAQLLKLAASEEALDLLDKIVFEQQNLCCKTIYEVKSSKRKMKELAKEIIEILAEQ